MNLTHLRKTAAQAREWAAQHYPEASAYHQEAFVNAVVYLTGGISCGDSGPSLREHLVARSLRNELEPGEWEFEEACRFAAKYCFAPATEYLFELYEIWQQEFCFDDDPKDVEILESLA